ncbi:MAG: hypothetical protein EHM70_15070, partial [Chloroflexota bacterium]
MSKPLKIPFQQLLDALLDESTPLNPRYLYRLSDLNDEESAGLQEIWPRIAPSRRKALLEDLDEIGANDYLLSFEAVARMALQDPEPVVRRSAIRILLEYEVLDLIPQFIGTLNTDTDASVRAAAATALGQYVYLGEIEEISEEDLTDIVDNLLRVVQGQDADIVRQRALESLGFSGREEVPPLIVSAYNSNDKEWVAASLFAMGRSADQQWVDIVMSMINNPYPAIRLEAVRAAGELEITDAVDPLLELLDDAHEDVRDAAIWSLSQIGGEGVRKTLEKLQEETDDDEEVEFIE